MIRYCIYRLATTIPVLLGISLLAFFLGILSPGDPAEFALNQNGLEEPTEEQILAMRSELGLDRPAYVRFYCWFVQVLQGNLGTSYITGRDIWDELFLRLPTTVELACFALVIAAVLGISMGVLCAIYKDSFFDKALLILTNIMLSIPSFWLSLVMILIFSELLRILPTSGSESWKHFIMPAFAVSFSTIATLCRFTRSAMLKEFGEQYFIIAKARGLSKSKLLFQYALPNAILPVIALLGNYWAGILGGSVIAESIFAIPGISNMALEAIRYRDYPVLQAYVLVTGWFLVIVTLGVDLLMAYFNPKIKVGEQN